MISTRRYMRIPRELMPSEIFKQDSSSPSKILIQIVLLQIFYYLSASMLMYAWAKICGYEIQMKEWLFSWEYIEFSNSFGLSMFILWLVDSLVCVFFLTIIVGRSKLAWDFAVTIHAINLTVVWVYTGSFPSLAWFILQLISTLVLVFLGTWITRWRELKDTFFEGMVDNGDGRLSTLQHGTTETPQSDGIEMKDLEAQK